jgi:hypothetical protein
MCLEDGQMRDAYTLDLSRITRGERSKLIGYYANLLSRTPSEVRLAIRTSGIGIRTDDMEVENSDTEQ